MQAAEVARLTHPKSASPTLALKRAVRPRAPKQVGRIVEANAAPATRTEARPELQNAPPPSRFPDLDLSVAVPAGFAEPSFTSRETATHAMASAVRHFGFLRDIRLGTWRRCCSTRSLSYRQISLFVQIFLQIHEFGLVFAFLNSYSGSGACTAVCRTNDMVHGAGRGQPHNDEGFHQLLWFHTW